MRKIAVLLGLLLAAVALVGCSGVRPAAKASNPGAKEKPRVEAAVSVTAPSKKDTPEATVGAKPSPGGASNKGSSTSSDAPFGAQTRAEGGAGFDADTLLSVRYGVHEGYERVVLDLGAGQKPAETVPKWTLVSPKGDGLLRVGLPSVSATDVSDGGFGDGLLKSFHVVRAPEGGMFVDVLARKAFLYRAIELRDPARLAVDFKPTGASLEVPLPASGGDTVLVEPRSGARVSDPLTVSGYSRNFEASNTIVLTDASGKTLARKTVSGNDWSSTWGYFEATLNLPPFSGKATLRVGTTSARDGSFRGVEIPVRGG